jgi:hypothetical protein
MAPPRYRTMILGHSFVTRAEDYARRHNVENLNLPTAHFDVEFLGKGGLTIREISHLFKTRVSDPELVIIDVGTIDLKVFCHANQLALWLIDEAKAIVAQGAKRIVFLGAINRTTHGKYGANENFKKRVREFNSCLQQHIKFTKLPLAFWYHKGLSARSEEYVVDGVHLSEEGLRKYIRSLSSCIMKFTRDL